MIITSRQGMDVWNLICLLLLSLVWKLLSVHTDFSTAAKENWDGKGRDKEKVMITSQEGIDVLSLCLLLLLYLVCILFYCPFTTIFLQPLKILARNWNWYSTYVIRGTELPYCGEWRSRSWIWCYLSVLHLQLITFLLQVSPHPWFLTLYCSMGLRNKLPETDVLSSGSGYLLN